MDAISGATITSQALGKCLNLWLTYYEPFLQNMDSALMSLDEDESSDLDFEEAAAEAEETINNEEE